MPDHLHSKIEHPLIHLVAALFTFSTITAAFLGYGIYEAKHLIPEKTVVKSVRAETPYPPWPVWYQVSWTGGQDSGSAVPVPWDETGGWDKYSSASHVIIDGNGVKDDGTGTGELISSIFDLGSERLAGAGTQGSGAAPRQLQTRVGSSVEEVQNALWGVDCRNDTYKYRYVQYRLRSLPSPSSGKYVSNIFLLSAMGAIEVTVKDASTSLPIENATLMLSGIEHIVETVEDFYMVVYDYDADVSSYSVTASAPGYQPQTKTISEISSETWCCIITYTASFALSKTSTSPPSSPPPSGSSVNVNTGAGSGSATTADTTPVSLSEFQQIKLPAQFVGSGSTTTDLSKVTDHQKVENFTLDVPGKNKIVFGEALDLSTTSTSNALKELDKYVKLDTIGIIELNSSLLPALNKKATLTISGLSFVSTPEILINGAKDTQNIVSNVKYEGGILTFDIAHFTRFTASPKLELISPTKTTIRDLYSIIWARISDPGAVVTGEFNGIKLAKITPDQKTGEFSLKKLAFNEGKNTLKLEAESKMGKVLPLIVTITYNPKVATVKETAKSLPYQPLLITLFVALAFAALLGYLIYRRKKLHFRAIFGSDEKKVQEQPESKQ